MWSTLIFDCFLPQTYRVAWKLSTFELFHVSFLVFLTMWLIFFDYFLHLYYFFSIIWFLALFSSFFCLHDKPHKKNHRYHLKPSFRLFFCDFCEFFLPLTFYTMSTHLLIVYGSFSHIFLPFLEDPTTQFWPSFPIDTSERCFTST